MTGKSLAHFFPNFFVAPLGEGANFGSGRLCKMEFFEGLIFFQINTFTGFRVILVWVEACLQTKTALFPILHWIQHVQCHWGFFFNESQENVNFKQLGLNIFTILEESLNDFQCESVSLLVYPTDPNWGRPGSSILMPVLHNLYMTFKYDISLAFLFLFA